MARQAEHEKKHPEEKAPGVGIEEGTTRGRNETAALLVGDKPY
jgi:hypothetical protein